MLKRDYTRGEGKAIGVRSEVLEKRIEKGD